MVERSKRIELRVTADELRQIHERMQEAGISSLTAYMIRMALHGYVIVMDLSDLKEVLRLLQISGNNLNLFCFYSSVIFTIRKRWIHWWTGVLQNTMNL